MKSSLSGVAIPASKAAATVRVEIKCPGVNILVMANGRGASAAPPQSASAKTAPSLADMRTAHPIPASFVSA